MRELTPLPRRDDESSREYAYRVLRENIITLTLPPGEMLNEHLVADFLSISRTPVREAIFTLRKENMVEVKPQTGSRVSLIDAKLLRQGIMMQVMVEMEIAARLSGDMEEGLIRRLRENLRQQQEALRTRNGTRRYLWLDDEFHRLLYSAVRKESLYRVTKTLSSQLDRLRYLLLLENRIASRDGYEEHKEIFIRLLAGMRDGFAALYLAHRAGVEKLIPPVAAKYPDYFKEPVAGDDGMRRLAALLGGDEGTEVGRTWD